MKINFVLIAIIITGFSFQKEKKLYLKLDNSIDITFEFTERDTVSFFTYKWKSFDLTFDQVEIPTSDYFIISSSNAKVKRYDSVYLILALDTNTIDLKIISNNEVIHEFTLKAKPNPHFSYAWDTLQIGEIPTPLTYEQYSTFKIFAQFLFLNKKIPEFNRTTTSGNLISDSLMLGKVIFINFWFNPCAPCVAELPLLNKIKDHYKHNEKVSFYSFFLDSIYVQNDSLLFQSRFLN